MKKVFLLLLIAAFLPLTSVVAQSNDPTPNPDLVDGTIYLESTTRDYCNYSLWHPLPEGYSYFRIATRSELRDYMYGLGRWELNIKLG